jgi:hypothetical protein
VCGVVLVVALAAAVRAADEGALWERIVALEQARPTETDAHPVNAFEVQRRELLAQVQLYLSLYPGGEHREDAVVLELQTLFELGALASGRFDALAERVGTYAQSDDRALRAEAAYWRIVLDRVASADGSAGVGTGGPTRLDPGLRRAYRAFLERYPESHRLPQLLGTLFDDALQRDALDEARALAAFAGAQRRDSLLAEELEGRLRRRAALGQPFPKRLRGEGAPLINWAALADRPLVLVVWNGHTPAARALLGELQPPPSVPAKLAVVVLSVDPEPTAVQATYATGEAALPAHWEVVHLPNSWAAWFPRYWGVRRAPEAFVLDAAGRLVGVARTTARLETLLKRAAEAATREVTPAAAAD